MTDTCPTCGSDKREERRWHYSGDYRWKSTPKPDGCDKLYCPNPWHDQPDTSELFRSAESKTDHFTENWTFGKPPTPDTDAVEAARPYWCERCECYHSTVDCIEYAITALREWNKELLNDLGNMSTQVGELRAENEELERQRNLLADSTASLLKRAETAEAENERLRNTYHYRCDDSGYDDQLDEALAIVALAQNLREVEARHVRPDATGRLSDPREVDEAHNALYRALDTREAVRDE